MHVLIDRLQLLVLIRVYFFEGFLDLESIVGLWSILFWFLLLNTRDYFDRFDLSICVYDVLCLQLELALFLFFNLATEFIYIVAFLIHREYNYKDEMNDQI